MDKSTSRPIFPLMQSGTLEISGAALKRLEELKIGGIDVAEVVANMEGSLKMLRLADVVNADNALDTTAALSASTELSVSVPLMMTTTTTIIKDAVVACELSDLTAAKLSLVSESSTTTTTSTGEVLLVETALSEHGGSSTDSDSGCDLAGDGDGDLEDVSLVSTASSASSAGSLSSRSSVTGGSTESLPVALAAAAQLQQQAAAAQQAQQAQAAAAAAQQQLRFAVLSYEQVARLHDVMNETVLIHGRGNFPTLELRLRDLVTLVRSKLEADGVAVRDMRINGGCASHVLALDRCQPQAYNDLDLIFGVDLSSARTYDRIKTAVLDALLDFLPAGVSRTRMLSCSLKEAYVSKMVKVTEGDRWSLISLGTNHRGKNVELKFVHTMRRQFEFSVDSFQIILDSLILFYDCASTMPISESFYPTVVAESVYGDFRQAHYHLHRKMIATRNPEEIRGGGLLKYCNLLVKDYRPADPDQIKTFERYMCSRFFIDFPDVGQQRLKLDNYLWNHFVGNDEALKYDFLMILYSVVDESTVCLMGHERRQTLSLIEELAYQVYYAEQQQQQQHQQQQQSHHHQQQQMHHHHQQQQQTYNQLSSHPPMSHSGYQTQHAPVYEVRISGCQPTVVYSSTSGGYFYAATNPQTSMPPPTTSTPPPSSSAATVIVSASSSSSPPPSSTTTTAAVAATTVIVSPGGATVATPTSVTVPSPLTAPNATACYPCSTPCTCSCAWMACA